jgi:hypothetical protein
LSDFYSEPTPDLLCQGDILITPHLYINKVDGIADSDGFIDISAQGRQVLGLIMNFDCELDKPWSQTVVVCPILPLSELQEKQRTDAKKNRIAHLFSIERYRDKWPDSVAVLNQQTTIDRTLIDLPRRLATLTTESRLAFYAQFVRWVSRWELKSIECPACETAINVESLLKVRNPAEP